MEPKKILIVDFPLITTTLTRHLAVSPPSRGLTGFLIAKEAEIHIQPEK